DFIVTDHRTRRTPPCAQHAACNTCLVHFGQGRLYRLTRLRPRTWLPAPQGVEYRILEPIPIRELHPSIDDHGHDLSQSQLTIGPSCIRRNCLKMAVADTLSALRMSAFGGKADVTICIAKCPLLFFPMTLGRCHAWQDTSDFLINSFLRPLNNSAS